MEAQASEDVLEAFAWSVGLISRMPLWLAERELCSVLETSAALVFAFLGSFKRKFFKWCQVTWVLVIYNGLTYQGVGFERKFV